MKKLFILSGLMLFVSILFAQPQEQIKNGGFEEWQRLYSTLKKEYYYDFGVENGDMLRTLNKLYAINEPMLPTELTSFRENKNPYAGTYSLRMETVKLADEILVPGAIGTISPNFIAEFLSPAKKIGLLADFYSKPIQLTGYYKYAPVNKDSAAIEIELVEWGERRAFALWKAYDAVSEWTKFEIPLNYTNEGDVNELKLIFAASAGYNFADLEKCRGQVGSKFWLDNIAFDYGAGLREPLIGRSHSTAYPNPATTTVTISFDKLLNGSLVIYNILGAEVATQAVNGNTVEANITHLAGGSYFYRVIEGNTIRTSGKFLVE